MTVNQRIKFLRTSQNFTIEELSEKTGININTLYTYEQGRSKPKPDKLKLLANALNVSVSELALDSETQSTTTAPQWAEDLMRKIDKLIELQTSQQGKMIELLGKHSGKPLTAMHPYLKVA